MLQYRLPDDKGVNSSRAVGVCRGLDDPRHRFGTQYKCVTANCSLKVVSISSKIYIIQNGLIISYSASCSSPRCPFTSINSRLLLDGRGWLNENTPFVMLMCPSMHSHITWLNTHHKSKQCKLSQRQPQRAGTSHWQHSSQRVGRRTCLPGEKHVLRYGRAARDTLSVLSRPHVEQRADARKHIALFGEH